MTVTPINKETPVSSDLAPLAPLVPSTSMTELAMQLGKMQTIERHLRDKIQTEGMALLQEHDRKYSELQHSYARKIYDATAKLESERDQMLRNLNEAYFEKRRELERIALHVEK